MTGDLNKHVRNLLEPELAEGAHAEAFLKLGFSDPSKAASLWSAILPATAITPGVSEHASVLVRTLAGCPDPDMALLNLSRFVDSMIAPSHFLSSLFLEKPICVLLVTIFSSSYYLSDILVRNTGYLAWLIERETLESPKSFSQYVKEAERQTAPFKDHRRRLNSIKRYKRREILRIGARDLLGIASVEEVTAELSFLTDAVIDITGRLSFEEEARIAGLEDTEWNRDEDKPFHRFAIISLGKLGGTELNYSSDIDLLYICEATEGKREIAFYTSLARRITNELSEATEEGTLFRVDLRLRPDGESGPLVVTVEEHLNYLLRRARPWEKQSLIKARFSAGNLRPAEAFQANTERIVFSSISGEETLADILAMRERAVANLPSGERVRNIKLMSGGIRDIEFIAQALQLLHGRSHREVRSRNTLEALERLYNQGYIDEEVRTILSRCYRLFRTVEHRLQLRKNVRTHTLPTGEEELHTLGARVSYSSLPEISGESFRAELGRSLRQVQHIFDSFFKDRGQDEIPLLLSLPSGETEVGRILSGYGIEEGEQAHRFLISLVYGDFPHLESPEMLHTAAKCLPAILERVSRTPDPSLTLKNLVKIVRATGATRSTLELLAECGDLLRLFLVISSLSTKLTDVISRRIELLDVLAAGVPPGELPGGPPGAQPGEPADEPPGAPSAGPPAPDGFDTQRRLRDLNKWREEMLLHIHCQNRVPESGPESLAPPLSEVMEETVAELFRMSGGEDTGIAIFALGSLGSKECRFGSDLDLLAVIPDAGNAVEATRVILRFMENGGKADIGPIDMRLRGEGDGSPLIQTLDRYRSYFDSRAAFWEMIAFTKCRFICGDTDTGKAFEEIIARALREVREKADLRENLLEARGKLESLSSCAWDVKYAPGGLYDIGYITSSAKLPSLNVATHSPFKDLESLESRGLLAGEETKSLTDAYRLFYLVEHAAALHGLKYPPLPEREEFFDHYMQKLLRGLIPRKETFTAALEEMKKNVREIFLRYIDRLQK